MKPNIKDAFREIKNTITKFISILLMVAMGVFILVGLLSTGDIMRDTLEDKLLSYNYPDIFVTAPMGFEVEDEYILENQEDISELEYGYDIDVNIKDSPILVKLINMPKKINMPIIIDGRSPKKGEILLDFKLKDMGYKIGDSINFSVEKNKFEDSTNDEDRKNSLKNYSYKIVGFAQNLDYIMAKNRGFSERGLGEIGGFGYIDTEEFNIEKTVCKIIYKETKGLKTSSKKYMEVLDRKYNGLKIDMKFRPSDRLGSIKSKISKEILEGEDEISRARRELLDGKDEIDRNKKTLSEKERQYLEGLAKFKNERRKGSSDLSSAKDELYKASVELEDGKNKLQSGYEKIQSGKEELNSAKDKLDKGKRELSDSKLRYEEGRTKAEMGEKFLAEGENELSEGRKKLDLGWQKIEESRKKLEEGKKEYNDGLNQYIDGKEKLDSGKNKLIEALGIAGLNYEDASSIVKSTSLYFEKYRDIDSEIKKSEDNLNSLKDSLNEVNDEIKKIKDVENNGEKLKELQDKRDAIQSQITSEENKLSALKIAKVESEKILKEISAMLPPGYSIDDISELMLKMEMAKSAIAEIDDNEKKLIEAKAKLDSSKERIVEGENQLIEGIREAEEGEKKYLESKSKLEDKKIEIEKAKEELRDAKVKLEDGELKLKDAESKYNEGLKDYDEGYKKYIDKKSEYDKGKAKYESGLEEYERGKDRFNSEIKKGENTLIDARTKLNEGKEKLREGEEKFNIESSDAEEKIEEGLEDIDRAKRYLNIIKAPRYSITPRYFVEDLNVYLDYAKRCDGLALIFPVFFFAIALLVCFTTMTRMVEEQRVIIGTYKALGYSNKKISLKFFLYGAIASLIGGIIGAIAGSYILTYIVGNAYSTESIMEDNLIIKPYIIRNLFSIFMGFLFTAIAAALTTTKDLRENTASLLRAKPPKKGTRILLERVKFIWNRLSFLQKVTARNIFRSKKRMIMTIIGIMGCSALLVMGFGIEGSVRNIATFQFDEILKHNISISFDREIDEESHGKYIKYLRENKVKYAEIYEESMNVEYPQKNQKVELISTENEKIFKDYINLRNPKNKKDINLPKRGVVVTKKLAKLKNLKTGDILKIRDVYDNEFEVEIKDICEMYVGHYIFMNSEYFEKVMGKDFKINTHLIKKDGIRDVSKFERDTIEFKSVVNVLNLQKMKDRVDQFIYPIKKVEVIILIVSSLLAIVVLYNLTNINIEERKREVATIKVLGFYSKETIDYVYRETFILTFLGIASGLLVGKILHYSILQIVVPFEAMLSDYLVPSSYVKSAIITIIVTIITRFIFHNKLKKINMVESLKSNE